MTTDSPAANAVASFSDERQLVEHSKRWSTAMKDHDRVMLEELMAPVFVLHKWDNTRNVARAAWFDFLFDHIKILEFEQTAIVAHIYGDVGVVTSKLPITRGTFDERPIGELHGYLTDVWQSARMAVGRSSPEPAQIFLVANARRKHPHRRIRERL